jgi:hypothetical protein
VGGQRRVVVIGLTTTKVLIIDVIWRFSIHHRSLTICLPRIVEDRWRKVHGFTNGRVLNVVCKQSLLTGLQLDKLLINRLPMGTNFLSIVFSNIEASKKTLR